MKTTSLALAAALLAGAFAAPAIASDSSFDGNWYVTQLQYKGVNAVAAYEGAPGEIRAVVKTADGAEIFQYFDDETLAPIAAAKGSNTRVLTKLDTGSRAHRAPTSNDSLLVDHFFD
jgi:hypothetical protein